VKKAAVFLPTVQRSVDNKQKKLLRLEFLLIRQLLQVCLSRKLQGAPKIPACIGYFEAL